MDIAIKKEIEGIADRLTDMILFEHLFGSDAAAVLDVIDTLSDVVNGNG
jgi:hypothetical protein